MEPILAAAEILRAMRNHVVTLISVAKWEFDKLGQVSPTTSVIPLENGIQVTIRSQRDTGRPVPVDKFRTLGLEPSVAQFRACLALDSGDLVR